DRSGAAGGTLGRRHAGAAIRVVNLHRPSCERRRREIAGALSGRGPRLAQALRDRVAIPFAREPEEGAVLDDRSADAASIQVVVGCREPAALLRRAALLREIFERLTPHRAVLEKP